MTDLRLLSRGQRDAFERDGFLVLEDLARHDEMFDETPYPTEGLVPLEAPKGTLVLIHGLLPHYSGPNRSERSRHAYTIHAIERQARYPADNWLQRSPDLPLTGFA